MSNKKLREKKKKTREKEARTTVLRRREAMRKKRQEEQVYSQLEKIHKVKLEPIVNPETIERQKKERADSIENQLKKNAELLKRLEQSYQDEQKNRSNLNESLESQGYETLKEKLDAIAKKSVDQD